MKKINKMQICAISLCIFLVAAVFSTAANGFNQPPVAVDDVAHMAISDKFIVIDILANDYDPDDIEYPTEPGEIDPTSVVIDQHPTQGTITVDGETGVVTYIRNNIIVSKMDTFMYHVSDIYGLESNIANVTIRFLSGQINTPPVARDDVTVVDCNENSIIIDVLINDEDEEDGKPSLDGIVQNPKNGTVTISGSQILYTHVIGFSGIDSFVYQVVDSGNLTDTATVNITVESCQENNPPVAINDSAFMTEVETAIKIDVAENDYDTDGELDRTTVAIVNGPSQGSVSVNDTTGIVTYIRNNDFIGSDNFTYTVNDTQGATSNIATVTINIIQENNPPVAKDDYEKTDEDEESKFDVLKNDIDPDGDRLNIVDVSEPYHGKAEIITVPAITSNSANQKILYTPDKDYNGEDEFEYTISDGHGGKDTAIVYINIAPVNDPPYIPSNPHPEEGETNVDIATDLSWTGGDPDGDNVTYDVYFGITNSFSSKINGNQKAETYDPGTLSYSTTYFWQIVAWDSNNSSTVGPIWNFTTKNAPISGGNPSGGSGTVGSVSNSPPVADASSDEPYHGFVDEELTFNGSLSFDSDGSIVSWSWNFGDGNSAYGEITTHAYSSIGTYLVTLIVSDNQGATGKYITTATIAQPNRPPSDPEIYGYEPIHTGASYSFAALSEDLDGDKIKYVFDWGDGTSDETGFISPPQASGISFIHSWDSAGTYTLTVTVSDNQTASLSEISVIVTESSQEYIAIIILGIIMTIFVVLSLILVKTGKIPKFGKK